MLELRLPSPAALRRTGYRFALAHRFVDQQPFPLRQFAVATLPAQPPAEPRDIVPPPRTCCHALSLLHLHSRETLNKVSLSTGI